MSQCRLLAKAVAIIDLVLCTISMLRAIALVSAGIEATAGKDKNFINFPGLDDNADIKVIYVVAAIWAIITALQMWLAIRLLAATEIGCDPDEALRFASHWWNVSASIFVLATFGFLRWKMYTELAINLVLHGGMIAIVYGYMQELKR